MKAYKNFKAGKQAGTKLSAAQSKAMKSAVCVVLVALSATSAAGYTLGSSRQVNCPMEYDPPMPNGKKQSMLRVASVANFMLPTIQDSWWTEPRVEEYMQPSNLWHIAQSKIAGCGVIAQARIPKGTKIGLVWVKDDYKGEFADLVPRHFTPWFGRAINHCINSDSHLEEDEHGSVYSVASRDIEAGEEVTGNYGEAAKQFPNLVEAAPASWRCPGDPAA